MAVLRNILSLTSALQVSTCRLQSGEGTPPRLAGLEPYIFKPKPSLGFCLHNQINKKQKFDIIT